jgi:hypothetical protein
MNWRFILLLLSMLAPGCGDSTGPSQRGDVAVAPERVTGTAAQALDANRHFVFSPLPAVEGEMSREEAVAVANAFFASLLNSVGNLKAALEEQHGRRIDFASLTMCGQVIPIAAPFLPTPIRPEAQYARNWIAGRYAFEFCQPNGVRTVGLEASAAAGVTIAADGTLRYPDPPIIFGNEFLAFGIPRSLRLIPGSWTHGLWALSPEAAVQALYSRVHTPIQTVPQATGCLWWLEPCVAHMARHWRLETAEPVAIRRQGAAEDELAQVFYVQVGLGAPGAKMPGGVYVPSREQPPPAIEVVDFMQQHTVIDSVLLTLAAPLAMDSFTVAGSSQ